MEYYSINQLAKLAGVTVRTLHHYDKIGLLKPSREESNSYRRYSHKELISLTEIMFFRELQFSLAEIKEILSSPNHNRGQILLDQKKLLQIKRNKLTKLIKIIDQNMTANNPKKALTTFSDHKMDKYKAEAKERWGNTDAHKQSVARTKNWTKEDYKRMGEEGLALTRQIALVMHLPVSDPKVQELTKLHHASIEVFYTCSTEMYTGLAEMYITDPRFTKYYEDIAPGLAQFVHDAILHFCDTQKAPL